MRDRVTTYWGDGIDVHYFQHDVSQRALEEMAAAGLSGEEVERLDKLFSAGEIYQDYVSHGSFQLRGSKICFFPTRIKGRSAANVLKSYSDTPGNCFYCKQPKWRHYVVMSGEGWEIECPKGKGE